jgi:hypothetical protein
MEPSAKRRQQLNAAAARWRANHRKSSTTYAQKTDYAAQRRWAKNNIDKIRKYTREAYWRNPEKHRAKRREQNRLAFLADPEGVRATRRRYYRTMMEKRVGRPRPSSCEICHTPFKKQPHADHDHKTGHYRGWVCNRCNSVLGLVKDDVDVLRLLALWIKNSGLGD